MIETLPNPQETPVRLCRWSSIVVKSKGLSVVLPKSTKEEHSCKRAQIKETKALES